MKCMDGAGAGVYHLQEKKSVYSLLLIFPVPYFQWLWLQAFTFIEDYCYPKNYQVRAALIVKTSFHLSGESWLGSLERLLCCPAWKWPRCSFLQLTDTVTADKYSKMFKKTDCVSSEFCIWDCRLYISLYNQSKLYRNFPQTVGRWSNRLLSFLLLLLYMASCQIWQHVGCSSTKCGFASKKML